SLPADSEVRKQELEIAKMLVSNLNAKWDPSKYTDEYRDNLMRIIDGKMKGKKVELEVPEERHDSNVINLMERLRASLGQTAKGPTRGKPRRSATKRTGKARKRTRRAA